MTINFLYTQIGSLEKGEVTAMRDENDKLRSNPQVVAQILSRHLEKMFLPKK